MTYERRPSAAEAASSTSTKKSVATVQPDYDAANEWLAVFSAGAVVDYAAWRLSILDQCSDEVLRNIACLASDDAVSMAYWLLGQRAA